MKANKTHFVDLILEMGWWSEEDIEWEKQNLFKEVSVIYITLSYQSGFLLHLYRVIFFFYCTDFLIFMDIIFCTNFFQLWTFNTRDVYKFILNLISLFDGVSFLFCCCLKFGVTKELNIFFFLKSKNIRHVYLFKTKQNFADIKTLAWPLQLYF